MYWVHAARRDFTSERISGSDKTAPAFDVPVAKRATGSFSPEENLFVRCLNGYNARVNFQLLFLVSSAVRQEHPV